MRWLVTGGALVAAFAVGAALWKQYVLQGLFTPSSHSLIGRTILITGGNAGLGLESAKRLATAGANIILTARSAEKGQYAVDQVSLYLQEQGKGQTYPEQTLSFQILELDKLSSVKQAAEWDIRNHTIDVLMNNAGVMALPNRELTEDGLERQFQTNHLGHFVLTAVLKDKLSKHCHIINVSSSGHKFAKRTGLDFDYMWRANTGYRPWRSYAQSKLANIYFTSELQQRADEAGLGWTATSVHPGAVATDLGRYMVEDPIIKSVLQATFHTLAQIGLLVRTVEHGATTQVWLASQNETEGLGGNYFVDSKKEKLEKFATDKMTGRRLWIESEAISGVEFSLP